MTELTELRVSYTHTNPDGVITYKLTKNEKFKFTVQVGFEPGSSDLEPSVLTITPQRPLKDMHTSPMTCLLCISRGYVWLIKALRSQSNW